MEDISIHALREEGDSATTMCRTGSGYFYPRPPRGGRRWDREGLSTRNLISIHALREEGDRPAWMLGVPGMRFLSTPSARRATIRLDVQRQGERQISIHALREEGDTWNCQSCFEIFISIHALREEGDQYEFLAVLPRIISIHALREEGDPSRTSVRRWLWISIHALREEGDNPERECTVDAEIISIHALREEGDSKNGEKHLRFCFIIKRSAQIWKSFSKNIRKKSRDLHRMP